MVGQTISQYKILEKLGAGGMGVVYKAEDTRLRRAVALKFLSAETIEDEVAKTRLIREAQAAAALDHPNICPVYGIHEEDGRTFIALAFIDGPSLADKIAERPLPLDEALDMAIQIAEGLQEAHQKGIVHRDIKPHNVMLTAKGQVKIMDFGLARLTGRSKLTKSGTTLGTPAYMPPEQLQGLEVDHRADVWALGIVLYEMLAQRTPFEADYEQAIAYGVMNEEPEPLTAIRSGLHPELDRLVTKLLAKNAEDRFQHMDDVLADLRAVSRSHGAGESQTVPEGDPASHSSQPQKSSRFTRDSTHTRPGHTGPGSATRTGAHVVGRDSDLKTLRDAVQQVDEGKSLIVGVSGEAGVGKTTLVEKFLGEITASSGALPVARGQCSERLAGSEAYLPFFDALESLAARDRNLARLMRKLAPWWFVQTGSLTPDDPSNARILGEVKNVTQERLKRELASFLRAASERRPVLLFIEDLHWADVSSVDLVAYLAARFDEMRLLIVTTYRPEEMAVSDHPFLQIKPDLLSRGHCQEVQLRYLSQTDIESYLALKYPSHEFPPELAELIFGQTEGSPLFMADLVRDLQDRGLISEDAEKWKLSQPVSSIGLELPSSIEAMIQSKIDALSDEDCRLLTVASVQGFLFDSAVAAAVDGRDEEEVEERLQRLDGVHRFVQSGEEAEFPDRTPTLRYRFVHVLYQNKLYDSLTRTRRIRLSRSTAETLEGFYGDQTDEVASQLGSLFEVARDFEKAANYLGRAAEQAVGVFAYQEAISLVERGLKLLEELPVSLDRDRLELLFQITLGAALTATRGYAHKDVGAAYTCMRELTKRLGPEPRALTATLGLSAYYVTTVQLDKALELSGELLALAQLQEDSALLRFSHGQRGMAEQFLGNFTRASTHFEQAVQDGDKQPESSASTASNLDLLVTMLGHQAFNTWVLGYSDQAIGSSIAAKKRAEELLSPFVLAHYLGFAAFLHQNLGNAEKVLELTDANIALSQEQGYPVNIAWASMHKGWALAKKGDSEEGLAMMEQGLATWRMVGMVAMVPYWHSLMAEIHGRLQQPGQGLALLEESFDIVTATKHTFFESDLHRMKGNLLLIQEASASEVEACYQKAVEVALSQHAKSYELRAAVAMSRLWQQQGRDREARQMLGEIYGWFTEGFDTHDLRDAKAALDSLAVE